jgi:putative MFS transporter
MSCGVQPKNDTGVNAGPRLDRLPIGAFHRRILLLIGAGMFFDSFDIYLAGGVLGALVKSGWSDLDQNARFISMTFVGMTIGAAAAGIVGDRFGRRASYQANLLVFGLASLAAAAAPTMGWLIAARFFCGVGLGAEIVLGYASLIEFIPPARRGRWSAYLSLITNTALFISTAIGALVIPQFGWRWMFVIAGAGALVVWWLRKKMPESPRWLESRGRMAEADALLGRIEAEAGAAPFVASSAAAPIPAQAPLAVLFRGAVLPRTLVAVFLSIVVGTAIYGFVAWLPTFFVKEGLTVTRSLVFSTLMSLGGPVGALIGVLIADRVGRRRGVIGASLIAAVLGVGYALTRDAVVLTAVGFGLVSMIYLLVTLVVAGYVPESFPTDYRMRGAGFAGTISRVWAIAVPYAAVALYNIGSVPLVVGVIAMLLLSQAAVMWRYGLETALKPLEALAPAAGGSETVSRAARGDARRAA